MPESSRAATLPECSIVVNDLAGKAFYAQHAPGYEPRWLAAAGEPVLPSETVDWELAHGARIIRIGDWPAPTEMWPDARERLARHLYLSSIADDWRGHHELLWDRHSERIDFDAVYARADELLAVITGTDG